MHNKVIKILVIVALLMCGALYLSGCAPVDADGNPVRNDTATNVYNYPPNSSIYDFKLEDGTRCIFVEDVREGGLSCDFKSKEDE